MVEQRTHDILHHYFHAGQLPDIHEIEESKEDMKKEFEKEFKSLLKNTDANPLLAFQVLYHRLQEIANVAKEVFYDPAVSWLLENDSGDHFGTKVTLKKRENWDVVKSPKIIKLEKEINSLEEKNSDVIKAFDRYQSDIKSIKSQIKAEEERLIEQGMGTKKEESHIITLSY